MHESSYIIRMNIERYKALLRAGRLSDAQRSMVVKLLAAAQTELAHAMAAERTRPEHGDVLSDGRVVRVTSKQPRRA